MDSGELFQQLSLKRLKIDFPESVLDICNKLQREVTARCTDSEQFQHTNDSPVTYNYNVKGGKLGSLFQVKLDNGRLQFEFSATSTYLLQDVICLQVDNIEPGHTDSLLHQNEPHPTTIQSSTRSTGPHVTVIKPDKSQPESKVVNPFLLPNSSNEVQKPGESVAVQPNRRKRGRPRKSEVLQSAVPVPEDSQRDSLNASAVDGGATRERRATRKPERYREFYEVSEEGGGEGEEGSTVTHFQIEVMDGDTNQRTSTPLCSEEQMPVALDTLPDLDHTRQNQDDERDVSISFPDVTIEPEPPRLQPAPHVPAAPRPPDINIQQPINEQQKRRSFSIEFKLEVLATAKKLNGERTAKMYGIDSKSIRTWRKQESQLRKLAQDDQKLKRLKGAGRGIKYPKEEMLMTSWILEERQKGTILTRSIVLSKMTSLTPGFSPTRGWVKRFMKRHNVDF